MAKPLNPNPNPNPSSDLASCRFARFFTPGTSAKPKPLSPYAWRGRALIVAIRPGQASFMQEPACCVCQCDFCEPPLLRQVQVPCRALQYTRHYFLRFSLNNPRDPPLPYQRRVVRGATATSPVESSVRVESIFSTPSDMADLPQKPDNVGQSASRPESFRSAASQPATSETPATSTQSTVAGAERDEELQEWTAPTDGPLKTPIPVPAPNAKPREPAPLSPEQETKYATVLAQVSQWQTLPTSTAKNAPQAPIADHERMWLTRECLLRYLRATKWKTPDALRRLQSTLSWRREYGADTFTYDYISPENETGKQWVPPQQLWKIHNGDLNFEYDHAAYWPALKAETDKRREKYRQRWELAGKRIGEYEDYLKGGNSKSLGQVLEEAGGVADEKTAKSDPDLVAAEHKQEETRIDACSVSIPNLWLVGSSLSGLGSTITHHRTEGCIRILGPFNWAVLSICAKRRWLCLFYSIAVVQQIEECIQGESVPLRKLSLVTLTARYVGRVLILPESKPSNSSIARNTEYLPYAAMIFTPPKCLEEFCFLDQL
ncbi:hypothetical protein L1887_63005 [Cichorium endivia]|nr:hypothetical protein L1887_63005 [Cichorium endivia]